MRKRQSIWMQATLVCAMIALLAGCGGSQPAPAAQPPAQPAPAQPAQPAPAAPPKLEKTAMKLGVSVKDAGFLPIYVADQKGFWKQEGLNIELVNFSGGSQQVQAITAGAIDLGAGAITEPIDMLVTKRNIVGFWGESNYPTYIWYGKPTISKFADLKGKGRVAISKTGSLTHQLSRWVAKQAGMDPEKDLQYVQAGNPLERVAALKAGQVDAIPATPPGTFILDKDGFKPLVYLKDYQPEFQYEVFYAHRDILKNNPETMKAFLRGWIKAARYAKKNPQDAAEILAKAIGAKPEDKADLQKTAELMLPFFFEDGHFAMSSVDMFLQFYKESGDFKELPKYEDFLDMTYINYFKANPVK